MTGARSARRVCLLDAAACRGEGGPLTARAHALGQVVGVKSREILLNAGNIHCITQQQPAAW
jgi:hypothetical protein